MENFTIPLKKRKGKSLLYIIALLFCTAIAVNALISLAAKFDWFIAGIAVITSCGAAIFGYSVYQYFTFGEIWLVVESDGYILRFFNKNSSGKVFNKSEDIKTAEIKNFYVIRKSTRYGSKNFAFGYDMGGILNKESIDAFPSLFESTQQDRESILNFVKKQNSWIELGYENIFQKLAKR